MLKIKENVDLKELEKFSYIKDTFQGFNVYRKHIPILNIDILIDIENRNNPIAIIVTDFGDSPNHDKRYFLKDGERYNELLDDLIKADLVEKVKE